MTPRRAEDRIGSGLADRGPAHRDFRPPQLGIGRRRHPLRVGRLPSCIMFGFVALLFFLGPMAMGVNHREE